MAPEDNDAIQAAILEANAEMGEKAFALLTAFQAGLNEEGERILLELWFEGPIALVATIASLAANLLGLVNAVAAASGTSPEQIIQDLAKTNSIMRLNAAKLRGEL
jgi:hypothetical protein